MQQLFRVFSLWDDLKRTYSWFRWILDFPSFPTSPRLLNLEFVRESYGARKFGEEIRKAEDGDNKASAMTPRYGAMAPSLLSVGYPNRKSIRIEEKNKTNK